MSELLGMECRSSFNVLKSSELFLSYLGCFKLLRLKFCPSYLDCRSCLNILKCLELFRLPLTTVIVSELPGLSELPIDCLSSCGLQKLKEFPKPVAGANQKRLSFASLVPTFQNYLNTQDRVFHEY